MNADLSLRIRRGHVIDDVRRLGNYDDSLEDMTILAELIIEKKAYPEIDAGEIAREVHTQRQLGRATAENIVFPGSRKAA